MKTNHIIAIETIKKLKFNKDYEKKYLISKDFSGVYFQFNQDLLDYLNEHKFTVTLITYNRVQFIKVCNYELDAIDFNKVANIVNNRVCFIEKKYRG